MTDEIKKGLLGIVVDETAISQVMPEINSLTYRGYAAQDFFSLDLPDQNRHVLCTSVCFLFVPQSSVFTIHHLQNSVKNPAKH